MAAEKLVQKWTSLEPEFKTLWCLRFERMDFRMIHVDVNLGGTSLFTCKNIDHMAVRSPANAALSCPLVSMPRCILQMPKKNSFRFGTAKLVLRTEFHGIIFWKVHSRRSRGRRVTFYMRLGEERRGM